jgi:hypothetical protein
MSGWAWGMVVGAALGWLLGDVLRAWWRRRQGREQA